MTQKLKFNLGKLENIVGSRENAGYILFSLFPTMFSKGLIFRFINSRDFVVKS